MNKNMRKMYTEEQIAKLGGTKLYKHIIEGITANNHEIGLVLINDKSSLIDTYEKLLNVLEYGEFYLLIDGYVDEVLHSAFFINKDDNDLLVGGLLEDDSFGYSQITAISTMYDTVTPLN